MIKIKNKKIKYPKEAVSRINGKLFRCGCGCNVCSQQSLNVFVCNSCGSEYIAEQKMVTNEEFEDKMNDLAHKHFEENQAVMEEYAFSRGSVKVGDSIQDDRGSIVVLFITVTMDKDGRFPECLYTGGFPARSIRQSEIRSDQ